MIRMQSPFNSGSSRGFFVFFGFEVREFFLITSPLVFSLMINWHPEYKYTEFKFSWNEVIWYERSLYTEFTSSSCNGLFEATAPEYGVISFSRFPPKTRCRWKVSHKGFFVKENNPLWVYRLTKEPKNVENQFHLVTYLYFHLVSTEFGLVFVSLCVLLLLPLFLFSYSPSRNC